MHQTPNLSHVEEVSI